MNFQGKEQCWERMNCGQDKDGRCSAHPDYGRLYWSNAGTKCSGRISGIHTQVIKDCELGEFFN